MVLLAGASSWAGEHRRARAREAGRWRFSEGCHVGVETVEVGVHDQVAFAIRSAEALRCHVGRPMQHVCRTSCSPNTSAVLPFAYKQDRWFCQAARSPRRNPCRETGRRPLTRRRATCGMPRSPRRCRALLGRALPAQRPGHLASALVPGRSVFGSQAVEAIGDFGLQTPIRWLVEP